LINIVLDGHHVPIENGIADGPYEDTSEEEANGSGDEGGNYFSDIDDDAETENGEATGRVKKQKNGLVDMEDLGTVMNNIRKKKTETTTDTPKKEMLTPLLRKSLEKQGYKLIGTHSGVKLCRWTKSMLRGRGGCYKHTFYGIESHRCMETTPSLACANKCVFCWRHHTNPVGTEWKWKMDDPNLIFENALKNHYAMINEYKGAPEVRADRLAEAFEVKHCALSLVGEPIMYPEINKFIDLLHSKSISTFLVTNAQFPEAIRSLKPVTQLYVSVDAPTKESLKRIDRPLFKDFWQRYLDSLRALAEKRQRTVYRLTLVKDWNTDNVKQYAELVNLGKPDFIEIKGVTYCGESDASSLTMKNVPWIDEVIEFVKQLQTHVANEYEIACEHQHSNCLLLAHIKFKINNEWYSNIFYIYLFSIVFSY
jgi:tRNA wybutosine-synthesizing protein 1